MYRQRNQLRYNTMERSETFLRDFVALTVTTMTVVSTGDSNTELNELKFIRRLAIELGLDLQQMDKLIAAELESQSDLMETAKRVAKESEEYKEELLKACTAVALSNSVLAKTEVCFLLALAEAIEVETYQVVLMIARMMQREGYVKIEE